MSSVDPGEDPRPLCFMNFFSAKDEDDPGFLTASSIPFHKSLFVSGWGHSLDDWEKLFKSMEQEDEWKEMVAEQPVSIPLFFFFRNSFDTVPSFFEVSVF